MFVELAGGSFKLATRYFMYWLGLSVQVTCVALQSWILALLWRRNLWRKFPILLVILLTSSCGQLLVQQAFPILTSTSIYWISAPGEMILMIWQPTRAS